MKLDGQSLEVVNKFRYLGNTVGTRRAKVDSVLTRLRNGWSKFRALSPFPRSRGFPYEQKVDSILFMCVVVCYMRVKLFM